MALRVLLAQIRVGTARRRSCQRSGRLRAAMTDGETRENPANRSRECVRPSPCCRNKALFLEYAQQEFSLRSPEFMAIYRAVVVGVGGLDRHRTISLERSRRELP